jgi:hypothetical protein
MHGETKCWLLCLSLLVACRPAPPRPRDVPVRQVAADTTGPGTRFQARTFTLTNPATRDSLLAVIRRERSAWQASGVRNYEVMVRLRCFCPGPQEWVVVQVRDGRTTALRSFAGRTLPLTRENDYNVDRLFEILGQNAMRDDVVEVAFAPGSHVPVYIRTDWRLGLPDDWGIFEVRNFRPAG